MRWKSVVGALGVALFVFATADTAWAGCPSLIRRAKCKEGTIKFEVCNSFKPPVEVFLNGCLVTTLNLGQGQGNFRRRIKLSGFGPGVNQIKGVNGRGDTKKRTVVCE